MPTGTCTLVTYDDKVLDRLQPQSKTEQEVWIADQPFGSGGCRQAFHCFFCKDGKPVGKKLVAKRYIRDEGFAEDYVCSQMANEVAKAFNQQGPYKKAQYLIPNRILTLGRENYSLEDFLEGQWEKHNDIFGNILSCKRTPAAFSHFSWVYSKNKYVILDVQGVGEAYTDPAVVSVQTRKFGYTDTGLKGIRDFFARHQCNEVCRALGLEAVGHIPDGLRFEDPPRPLGAVKQQPHNYSFSLHSVSPSHARPGQARGHHPQQRHIHASPMGPPNPYTSSNHPSTPTPTAATPTSQQQYRFSKVVGVTAPSASAQAAVAQAQAAAAAQQQQQQQQNTADPLGAGGVGSAAAQRHIGQRSRSQNTTTVDTMTQQITREDLEEICSATNFQLKKMLTQANVEFTNYGDKKELITKYIQHKFPVGESDLGKIVEHVTKQAFQGFQQRAANTNLSINTSTPITKPTTTPSKPATTPKHGTGMYQTGTAVGYQGHVPVQYSSDRSNLASSQSNASTPSSNNTNNTSTPNTATNNPTYYSPYVGNQGITPSSQQQQIGGAATAVGANPTTTVVLGTHVPSNNKAGVASAPPGTTTTAPPLTQPTQPTGGSPTSSKEGSLDTTSQPAVGATAVAAVPPQQQIVERENPDDGTEDGMLGSDTLATATGAALHTPPPPVRGASGPFPSATGDTNSDNTQHQNIQLQPWRNSPDPTTGQLDLPAPEAVSKLGVRQLKVHLFHLNEAFDDCIERPELAEKLKMAILEYNRKQQQQANIHSTPTAATGVAEQYQNQHNNHNNSAISTCGGGEGASSGITCPDSNNIGRLTTSSPTTPPTQQTTADHSLPSTQQVMGQDTRSGGGGGAGGYTSHLQHMVVPTTAEMNGSTTPPLATQHTMSAKTWRIYEKLLNTNILTKKTMFLKYGKNKNPHRRHLQLNLQWEPKKNLHILYLCWQDVAAHHHSKQDPPQRKQELRRRPLDGLKEVILSCAGQKFQAHLEGDNKIRGRKDMLYDRALCFTLSFNSCSLDLLALKPEDFQLWISAFQTVVDANNGAHPEST